MSSADNFNCMGGMAQASLEYLLMIGSVVVVSAIVVNLMLSGAGPGVAVVECRVKTNYVACAAAAGCTPINSAGGPATNAADFFSCEAGAAPEPGSLPLTKGAVAAVCGNGVCETGENMQNCLQDCPVLPTEYDNGDTGAKAEPTSQIEGKFVKTVVSPDKKTVSMYSDSAVESLPNVDLELDKEKEYIIELKEPSLLEFKKTLGQYIGERNVAAIESTFKQKILAQKSSISKLQAQLESTLAAVFKTKVVGRYKNVLNGIAIKTTAKNIQQIKLLPEIKAVYEVPKFELTLEETRQLTGTNNVWNLKDPNGNAVTGKGIVVAVIDSGIDYTHSEFGSCSKEQFLNKQCEKVIGGYDYYSYDNNPMDELGHGTHVASIIAGNGLLKGIAPDAKLLVYKVGGADNSLSGTAIMQAFDAVLDPNGDSDFSDHVDVVNMSFGGYGNPGDEFSQKVDELSEFGIVMVAAAGNSGPSEKTIGSPGTARSAITVGASYKSNFSTAINYPSCSDYNPTVDQLACFSSRGPTESETLKPDVVAPGVSVCAAQWDTAFGIDDTYNNPDRPDIHRCLDQQHMAISGTSMATPVVAGIAALILQKNPAFSPAEVKSALTLNAKDTGNFILDQGAGRVNALKSVATPIVTDRSAIDMGNIYAVEYGFFSIKNVYNTAIGVQVFGQEFENKVGEKFVGMHNFNGTPFCLQVGGSNSIAFAVDPRSFPIGRYQSDFLIKVYSDCSYSNELSNHSLPVYFTKLKELTVNVDLSAYPKQAGEMWRDLCIHLEKNGNYLTWKCYYYLEENYVSAKIPIGNEEGPIELIVRINTGSYDALDMRYKFDESFLLHRSVDFSNQSRATISFDLANAQKINTDAVTPFLNNKNLNVKRMELWFKLFDPYGELSFVVGNPIYADLIAGKQYDMNLNIFAESPEKKTLATLTLKVENLAITFNEADVRGVEFDFIEVLKNPTEIYHIYFDFVPRFVSARGGIFKLNNEIPQTIELYFYPKSQGFKYGENVEVRDFAQFGSLVNAFFYYGFPGTEIPAKGTTFKKPIKFDITTEDPQHVWSDPKVLWGTLLDSAGNWISIPIFNPAYNDVLEVTGPDGSFETYSFLQCQFGCASMWGAPWIIDCLHQQCETGEYHFKWYLNNVLVDQNLFVEKSFEFTGAEWKEIGAKPPENCELPDDEDGDGLVDCADKVDCADGIYCNAGHSSVCHQQKCETVTVLIQCQSISKSGAYVLGQSVSSTTGPCISIYASNVLLDCQGNAITGMGSAGSANAIHVRQQISNVTVQNCEVSGFLKGIAVDVLASNIIVRKNNVHNNNREGIFVENSAALDTIPARNLQTTTIADNEANLNETGIYIYDSGKVIVSGNKANNNKGSGIAVALSKNITITSNTANSNETNGIFITKLQNVNQEGIFLSNNTACNNAQYDMRCDSSTSGIQTNKADKFYGCSVGVQGGSCPADCCCDNLYYIDSSGNCVKKILSVPNYNCTFCHGFCYAKKQGYESYCSEDDKYYEWSNEMGFGVNCTSDADCTSISPFAHCIDNLCLNDFSLGSKEFSVKVDLDYPRFVKMGAPFTFTAKITNTFSKKISVKIFNVWGSTLAGEANPAFETKINFESEKEINPQESVNFEINIPGFEHPSFTANVQFELSVDNSPITLSIHSDPFGGIIVYPCDTEDLSNLLSCGNLKYCKYYAACIDNVLYPTGSSRACFTNEDCFGPDVCLNYSCENPSARLNGLSLNKTNKIGVLGVFIYDDDSQYNATKQSKLAELNDLAISANNWFNSERKFWNASNQFSANFSLITTECRLTRTQFLNILRSCEPFMFRDCEFAIIGACGISKTQDIIAKHEFWQDGLLDQEIINELNRVGYPGAAGLNLGDIVLFAYQDSQQNNRYSVLIHEILHSFGEIDLYLSNGRYNSYYQEGNCYLYRADWPDFEEYYPHLCNWEAKIIGWKQ